MQRVRSFKTRAQAWLTSTGDGEIGEAASATDPESVSSNAVAEQATSSKHRRRLPAIPQPGDTEDPLLRRLEDMIERCEFAAAVQMLDRLSDEDFSTRCLQLPYKKLSRAFLPDSLRLLETVLTRIDRILTTDTGAASRSGNRAKSNVQLEFPTRVCEDLAVQLGLFFVAVEGTPSSFEAELQSARRVLELAVRRNPPLYDDLSQRRSHMCAALSTLQRPLAEASSVHSSIRDAASKALRQLKSAVEKLETNPSATPRVNHAEGKEEVVHLGTLQERLFARQSVLNSVKTEQLSALLDKLNAEASAEKDVLTVVNQIKRDLPPGLVPADKPLAPIIEQHLHAFELLLGVLEDVNANVSKPLTGDDNPVRSSQSPQSVKRDRAGVSRERSKSLTVRSVTLKGHNFELSPKFRMDLFTSLLAHSRPRVSEVKSSPAGSAPSSPAKIGNAESQLRSAPSRSRPSSGRDRTASVNQTDDVRLELDKARKELIQAYEMINQLKKREKELTNRLSEQAQRQLEVSGKFEELGKNNGPRPTQLVQQFEELYSQSRVEALDALDDLDFTFPPDVDEAEWKASFLLKVVEAAFTHSQSLIANIQGKVKACLTARKHGSAHTGTQLQLESAICGFLRDIQTSEVELQQAVEKIEEELGQQEEPLENMPELFSCGEVHSFVVDCVRLSWEMCVQVPALLPYSKPQFFIPEQFTRFYTSDMESSNIKYYLWPALMQGEGGPVISRGIVVT